MVSGDAQHREYEAGHEDVDVEAEGEDLREAWRLIRIVERRLAQQSQSMARFVNSAIANSCVGLEGGMFAPVHEKIACACSVF
jgi:hypothetical protein